MKIIFNIRSGLGNNGGSITIINCANELSKLGHDVEIIDRQRNQNTWVPLKVKHKIIKSIDEFPECDVVVATDYKSVNSTIKIPENKCKLKLHYMRAWESWVMPEKQIIDEILGSPLIKIVNGICLKNKLKKYGIDSFIIRPGNTFEDFGVMNKRNKNRKVILGGLYHVKHKTKRSDWDIEISRILKSKYKNVELWMFGGPSDPHNLLVDKYIKQPSIKEKNEFYNNVDIWLATSCLESLHIVPQEYMLTGGCVVGNNSEMSGTMDYLFHEKTGIVSENNLKDFIKCVELAMNDFDLRKELGKNGREKIIELGNREKNMKEFIDLMENLISNEKNDNRII